VAKRMLIVACFEHDRWKKLGAMLKGIRHFFQGKTGRL
jgi:hypothetical protein